MVLRRCHKAFHPADRGLMAQLRLMSRLTNKRSTVRFVADVCRPKLLIVGCSPEDTLYFDDFRDNPVEDVGGLVKNSRCKLQYEGRN